VFREQVMAEHVTNRSVATQLLPSGAPRNGRKEQQWDINNIFQPASRISTPE
jgi:hypothetical protein